MQEEYCPTTTHVKGIYWESFTNMSIKDIDTNLFTHVIYYGAENIDKNSGKITFHRKDLAREFTSSLHQKNHTIKIILSIGFFDTSDILFIAENASIRKSFIESSIELARNYNFSGFIVSWITKLENESLNMGILLKEWHLAVLNEAMQTKMTKLLLIVGLAEIASLNFPFSSIQKYIDWIMMDPLCYSPKNFPSSTGTPYQLPFLQSTINSWIQAGLPRDKLVLCIPFFGCAWKLVNPTEDFGIGAKANGPDESISLDGLITYKEIKAFMQSKCIRNVYDESSASNYCTDGNAWIGYDDVEAIDAKISYAKQNRLLGYVAYNNSNDDDYILSKRASETWDACKLPIFIQAKELKIDGNNWKWIEEGSSRSRHGAKLHVISITEVSTEIRMSDMTLGQNYTVYLIYRLAERHLGPEYLNIVSRIYIDKYFKSKKKVCLESNMAAHPRDDGWFELALGEFFNIGGLKVSVALTSFDKNSMGGFIIDGIEFRINEEMTK